MGSGKKHKHKDSKTKAEQPDDNHSTRDKRNRKETKRKNKEDDATVRRRSRSPADKRSKKSENTLEQQSAVEQNDGGRTEISLSIAETNKLREKLGLAPLKVDEKKPTTHKDAETGETTETIDIDGKEHTFYRTENWGDKKRQETLREKLQAMREKRKIHDKLNQVTGLGQLAPDEDDSAHAWVAKSRRQAEEVQAAQRRAQMLEEMDNEFGVGAIVDEVSKGRQVNSKGYTGSQLAGMTVGHAKSAFAENRDVILVLKDREVLDEGEDVLVNPLLADEEVWKKNVELRKKKPGYNPYEEQELDELGMPKMKQILSKYDEEIEGEQRETFKLEAGGKTSLTQDAHLLSIREKLQSSKVSMLQEPLKLASEYFTQEEMAQFRKPSKKRVKKLRKREALKADHLLAASTESTANDFGSRQRGKGRHMTEYEEKKQGAQPSLIKAEPESSMDLDASQDEPVVANPVDDLSGIAVNAEEEDEIEKELQSALERARRLRTIVNAPEQRVLELVGEVKTEPLDEEDVDVKPPMLPGMAGNREQNEVGEVDQGDDNEDMHNDSTEPVLRTADGSSSPTSWVDEADHSQDDDLEATTILEDEPEASGSVAAALQLALQKGYLQGEKAKGPRGPKLTGIQAQNYSIMDKQFQDIDDKYARKLERMGMGGPTQDFREKKDYKPDFKLEYADEGGRLMNEKEAFQFLSWKFHGKKPGKKKLEKMSKKQLESQLMMEMSSTDTPLRTLDKQVKKQKQMQVPYIVLSGAAAKDMGTSLKKI